MIIQTKTNYLRNSIESEFITSDFLRSVADQMEEDGIKHIELLFDAGYNNVDIQEYSYREETKEEKRIRLKKEKELVEKNEYAQAKKKQRMIVEARKMGLTVSNVDPIKSNYDRVYWVPKGTLIEDWVVDKDGYVWYDEVCLLGERKTYGTAKKANEALAKYMEECL